MRVCVHLYVRVCVSVCAQVHIDMGAAIVGVNSGPGRPEGGEPCGLRAVWHWLHTRYTIPQ